MEHEVSHQRARDEHQWRMPAWKQVHEIFWVDFINS